MASEGSEKYRQPVLVAGATGYIGARLIPRLLEQGVRVRALARTPAKLKSRPWACDENLEIVSGDLFDAESMVAACRGCRAAYYLVHSMNPASADFAASDRQAALNMVAASEAAGLERLIYLSGLGEEGAGLSEHLRSRAEVAEILRGGKVPVTVFRAAMIIGSGSASFEILRYLVERLPVMVTPRWVDTPCQPIGVRNVLHYLAGALDCPQTVGETFDIGQEQVLTYRQLMVIFAEEAGLRKRLIIPVPVLTPRLSSYWIHLVTPVPAALARPLAEGLRNEVVCHDTRIRELLPQELLDCRQAIALALERVREHRVESSWADAGKIPPAEWALPGDPAWAGGTLYEDRRQILLQAEPEEVWKAVVRIGGETGWYYGDWLWRIRGIFDRLAGGIGLQRGRRCPIDLYAGDALDFWRVSDVDKPHRLELAAEMKVPGQALLEFRLEEQSPGATLLRLEARFLPRGVAGILYWYAVCPLHDLVFNGMLRGIASHLGKSVLQGPEKQPRGGEGMKPLLLALGALFAAGCALTPQGVRPVEGFDAERYLGTWYEIARLDHRFERGLSHVSADYVRRDDGGIRVVNRGYDRRNKKWKEATGRAYFAGDPGIARLRVSFFRPFYGGYNVIALDRDDYSWALVCGPNRDYLWILSRSRQLGDATLQRLLETAAGMGFDTGKLIYPEQNTPTD